jgi:hypothetical protein
MRGLVAYLLAAGFLVVAIDAVAPPVGLGFAVASWPAVQATDTQFVDRTGKGDRLTPATLARRPVAPANASLGCELPFSPLSATALAEDFARRCVA